MKYIKSTSNLSPKNDWTKMSNGDKGWSFESCPWVICDNVFTSVTFTGDVSWSQIVVDLFKKGQKSFTVLCGRHGDQLGQQVDLKTGKFLERDPGDTAIDPADDANIARHLNGRNDLSGIIVAVVGLDNGTHDTVSLLTTEIRSHLSGNRFAILAWCFSLFAMKPGWDSNVKNAWAQVFSGPDMTPISFTAKDWSWASTYPKCTPAMAADLAAEG